MKLGVKFAISLVIPLVTLMALLGYLYQQRSRVLLREELVREGRAIALVVQIAAEDYLRDHQLGDLRQMVDRISGYERVLGLRLFDRDGRLTYQSASLDSFPFIHERELRGVLDRRVPAEMRRFIGTQPAGGFIFPLSGAEGHLFGAVQVLQLESFMQEDARANRDFIVMLSLVMAFATVLIISLMTRFSVTRPIEELVRSFREVGAGELSARVPVRGDDELGRLAREFNGMCERLESVQGSLRAEQEQRLEIEARLRNAQRLAGLGRLAAGLAHEIGTPLNVISGRAEALSRNLTGNPTAERHLRIISTQIDRIVRIVRDMLDFARMKRFRRGVTHLAPVMASVLELVENQLQLGHVRVDLSLPPSTPSLLADADQLHQVFLNLVLNAVDAMPEGGTLSIHGERRSVQHPARPGPPLDCLAVRFEDSGAGIPAEHRARVFDPFFTTKETGKGTGLGLSVSYGIVEEHGGWIDLDSEEGRGTRITVFLPLETPSERAAGAPTPEFA